MDDVVIDNINHNIIRLDSRINDLVANTPEDLDTLKEIADAISGNKDLIESIQTALTEDTTTNKVVTNNRIPVSGGPLAELLNQNGITEIDENTDLQSLLMLLFTLEIFPTLTFTEGTVRSAVTAPELTIKNGTTALYNNRIIIAGTDLTIS